MRRVPAGLMVLAAACLAGVAGFVQAGHGFYAILATLGLVACAAAAWLPPAGWALLAALMVVAGIGFTSDFGGSAAGAAFLGAAGFVATSLGDALARRRLAGIGFLAAAAAGLWFALDRWPERDWGLVAAGLALLLASVLLAAPAKTVN